MPLAHIVDVMHIDGRHTLHVDMRHDIVNGQQQRVVIQGGGRRQSRRSVVVEVLSHAGMWCTYENNMHTLAGTGGQVPTGMCSSNNYVMMIHSEDGNSVLLTSYVHGGQQLDIGFHNTHTTSFWKSEDTTIARIGCLFIWCYSMHIM